MNHIIEAIRAFTPECEQERRDQSQMLAFFAANTGWMTRENPTAHLTVSGWVTCPERNRVLMVFHNIYQSWSWTGGHADGETDLLGVALREAQEETGILARPVFPGIFSLESLCVEGHSKRGQFVSPHIHMNVTYLLEADPALPTRKKADENSAVAWIPTRQVEEQVSERYMRAIYAKLIQRMQADGNIPPSAAQR